MATYPYEQLNGESFQQLCQSLLVKAFPELQCFPVGQPDGGRDAIFRFSSATPPSREFVLYQVKFARRELTAVAARDWLLETVKNELPKVQRQIEKGAKQFILITNVAGTAHSGSGTIDRLQALLDEHIPITARAWWRDDLDRRLDDAWDIKFAYPALFSGTDLLRLVVEASSNEGQERRRYAIKTFLSEQFEADREVKFKQAELQNDIFHLFTDVPLVPRIAAERNQRADERLTAAFRRNSASSVDHVDPFTMHQWLDAALGVNSNIGNYYSSDEAWMGAASLLLDRDFQQAEPLLVLEGAPGQGKSTIAQFICQIHRMHFLDRAGHEAADTYNANSALRLPFKVELRDFATWVSGGNPFDNAGDSDLPNPAPRSLETFLAALVQFASGGSEFSVSDLHSTLNTTPALIVLDGLDEVADTKQRTRVVEEIESAVSRLGSLDSPLQVVVTSRPTPFVNSAVLPRRSFATYSLDSLSRPLIEEYAERWLQSRDIDRADAKDVRDILNRQIEEPHLRDLARNPMQLAILLNLIHRRGVSLPDKRTALYDDYVQLFFDRESEKAPVVKENRDLLIRIHRYLAWTLHSDAEDVSNSRSTARRPDTPMSSRAGTISEGDLKELVQNFLERDGSDTSLVDKLFDGMVERVVAIVSRVQGSYEFDVQTLREYFAARHLYETAKYSPTGNHRQGTISDRWRALSRNYYWFNVARFYAGCYSEGELPSLIDELQTLHDDEVFRRTSHPQLLAATLLSDWVFSQRPRSTQDAVDLLLQPRGLCLLLASTGSGLHSPNEVTIRDPIGRERLLTACKELVALSEPFERNWGLVRSVLRPNAEAHELLDWWIERLNLASETEAKHWCVLGEHIGCWSEVDFDTVTDLLASETIPSSSVIAGLLDADRMDILETTEPVFEAATDAVLSGAAIGRFRRNSVLAELAWSIETMSFHTHRVARSLDGRASLREYQRNFRFNLDKANGISVPSYDTAQRCARIVEVHNTVATHSISKWNSSIEPWNDLVQQGVDEFGERRKFIEIANIAAGIRSADEKCLDSPALFDRDRPLVRRVRYARLRAGSQKWWSEQLQSAGNADEQWMALLVFATWAGARTIETLAAKFDNPISNLAHSDWQQLYSSLQNVANVDSNDAWTKAPRIRVDALPSPLSARTAALLMERCTRHTADKINERYLNDDTNDDPIIVSLRTNLQVRRALGDRTYWPEAIEGVKRGYKLGASVGALPYHDLRSRLPAEIAREVVDNPLEFPPTLVWAAEMRCRRLDASRVLPVGRAAATEGWFSD